MPSILVRCSAADRDLGASVTAALNAAGHHAASPDLGAAAVSPAAQSASEAQLGVILVTRRWSQGSELARVLAELGAASIPALLVWWDEDAPSDFLGNGGRAQETIDVFYACFLPAHDRIPALVERLRGDLEAST